MIPASIPLLVARIRQLYNVAAKITKVSVVSSLVAKEFDIDGPLYSQRVRHDDNDPLTLLYLSTLLWIDLEAKASKQATIDSGFIDAFFDEKFLPPFHAMADKFSRLSDDASINDASALFVSANVDAYVKFLAPQWNDVLSAYLTKRIVLSPVDDYVLIYHTAFVNSSVAMRAFYEALSHTREESIREQLNKVAALCSDKETVDSLFQISSAIKSSWTTFVPASMYFASFQMTKLSLISPPGLKRGMSFIAGPPLFSMVPSSFQSIRSNSMTDPVRIVARLPRYDAEGKEVKYDKGTSSMRSYAGSEE